MYATTMSRRGVCAGMVASLSTVFTTSVQGEFQQIDRENLTVYVRRLINNHIRFASFEEKNGVHAYARMIESSNITERRPCSVPMQVFLRFYLHSSTI